MYNQCEISDHGPGPYVTNIDKDVLMNRNFRTAIWTGTHAQVTLMCIPAGSDIGMEVHQGVDQILYIVSGRGETVMGGQKNCLDYKQCVSSGSAVFIPAGTRHNLKNTGSCPLKLFSVYAPPNHPFGTVHPCREEY